MIRTSLTIALLTLTGLANAAEPPEMKMTTEIPPGIATPDRLETRVGTFELRDGIPDEASIEKVYNYLDFHNGVQAYLNGIQIASMSAIRRGILEFGPPNTTALIFEELMDSKALFLTANTTSVYMMLWLEMKEGEPMVVNLKVPGALEGRPPRSHSHTEAQSSPLSCRTPRSLWGRHPHEKELVRSEPSEPAPWKDSDKWLASQRQKLTGAGPSNGTRLLIQGAHPWL